jgi:hypothetical protein
MRKHRLDMDGGLAAHPICILLVTLSEYGCITHLFFAYWARKEAVMKVANLMMVHLDYSFDLLSLSGVIVKFSHFIHLFLNFGIRIRG